MEFVFRVILDVLFDMYEVIINLEVKKYSRVFEVLDI